VDFSVDTGNVCTGLCKVASGILQHGVTSFCPTIVTSKPAVYKQVCEKLVMMMITDLAPNS